MAPTQSLATSVAATSGRIDRFLANGHPPAPYIVVDLGVARARYTALREALSAAEIYYAVKANPAPEIINAVAALGANFDLASLGEIGLCLDLNISPQRLSYGNTIKHEASIVEAADAGIGLFAFDSAAELDQLGRRAPGPAYFAAC
jgi:ornithine decarboxylase